MKHPVSVLLAQHCIGGDEETRKVYRMHSVISKLMVLDLNCITVVALETAISM